jgi:hypothetical protein
MRTLVLKADGQFPPMDDLADVDSGIRMGFQMSEKHHTVEIPAMMSRI